MIPEKGTVVSALETRAQATGPKPLLVSVLEPELWVPPLLTNFRESLQNEQSHKRTFFQGF